MGNPGGLVPRAGGYRESGCSAPGHVEKEVNMVKTRLLQAACAVAMLAAVPALAQRPEAGMTGPNGTPNPAAQQPSGNGGTSANSSISPASPGTDSSAAMEGRSTHRSAMAHRSGAVRGQTDTSQDAAVDQLNEQSYQAAQQGMAFGNNSSAANTTTMPPSGPGSASDMSGGSMAAPDSSTAKP
jgi:hypothetical protein